MRGAMFIVAAAVVLLALSGVCLFRIQRAALRRARELRDHERKLGWLSDHALDAIVMADAEGCLTYWNAAAERLFGYPAQEVLGRQLHQVLAPQRYRRRIREGYAGFSLTGQGAVVGRTLVVPALRKSGAEFPVELSVSAVRVGGVWNAIGVARDISGRQLREPEFQPASQQPDLPLVQPSEAPTADATRVAEP